MPNGLTKYTTKLHQIIRNVRGPVKIFWEPPSKLEKGYSQVQDLLKQTVGQFQHVQRHRSSLTVHVVDDFIYKFYVEKTLECMEGSRLLLKIEYHI